ncbi:hypothetical protein FB45DRAFT_1011030 [Roridomyces roridus]|uniref:Transaldolase n=1 Tax=Roridomyces roridus TaxID=1738132 RepID=A0AAD7FAB1_9AGAR|nr:hypothetical protein FB45DRAFT_1011030 [Roridomyces roridus]
MHSRRPIINHRGNGRGNGCSGRGEEEGYEKEKATKSNSTASTSKSQDQPKQQRAAILADTLDYAAVSMYNQDVRGAVMTPASLLTALEDPKDESVFYHLWVAARQAVEEGCRRGGMELRAILRDAMERLVVEAGWALRERSGGRLIAFVDPRRYDDAGAMARSARRLVRLFRLRGVSQSDVFISIPATEDGVAAARELAEQGIRTNLTLVAGLMHAAVCAEAGATTVTIAVGPLLDAHERRRGTAYPDLALHPGIEIIQAIQAYFELHNLNARLVGRDFRKFRELQALPGFDAICLTETQLAVPRWQATARGGSAKARHAARAPAADMRARQAQRPSEFLEHVSGAGFMEWMSASAREILAEAMFPALEHMEIKMNIIERTMQREVAWQLTLRRTVSLRELEVGLEQGRTEPQPTPPPANRESGPENEKTTKKDTGSTRTPLGDQDNVQDPNEYF